MTKQHAIIVGGTRGLGRVVARLFAADGMKVSVIGAHDPDPADAEMVGVDFYRADLTDEAGAREGLMQIVRKCGAPSYVVFAQRYRGAKEESWRGELELMPRCREEFWLFSKRSSPPEVIAPWLLSPRPPVDLLCLSRTRLTMRRELRSVG